MESVMSLADTFLIKYHDASFMSRQKAKTLFYFNLFLVVILPILVLVINIATRRNLISLLNFMIVLIIIGMGLSLLFLRAGKYSSAAGISILSSLVAFLLYSLTGSFAFSNGVIWTIYHLVVFIVFSSLFGGKKLTLVVFLSVIAGGWSTVIYRNILGMGETKALLVNFTFVCTIIYIMSNLLHSINSATMKKLKEEAENRKQFEQTKELLESVREISKEMSEASVAMETMSSSFSVNAQNQAAVAEEITATVEEISAGVERVADSAQGQVERINALGDGLGDLSGSISAINLGVEEATALASAVTREARAGESGMREMTASMNRIGATAREMTAIVEIINDISDRINLLSLNASIEAARAGDAGRGFAVVADEISKLADQTSSSVKDIDRLIKATESEIESGVTNVGSAVNANAGIIKRIAYIDEKINAIQSGMMAQVETNSRVNSDSNMVKARSEEIFNAANEQRIAAGEIVKSISVINELTQANAAGSEEMAGSAKQVALLAEKLREKVENYNC